LYKVEQAGVSFTADFQKSFNRDVFKWLLVLGVQTGCLYENERERYTCLIPGLGRVKAGKLLFFLILASNPFAAPRTKTVLFGHPCPEPFWEPEKIKFTSLSKKFCSLLYIVG
jgi:hypothetical protein